MLNPDSLTLARLQASLSRDDLAARAAAIGRAWLTAHDDDNPQLQQDMRIYIDRAELGELPDADLPLTSPYLSWLAQALDTTVLRLVDQPLPVHA